jgi:hypothetical protein
VVLLLFTDASADILDPLLQLQVLLLKAVVPEVFLGGQQLLWPLGVGAGCVSVSHQNTLDDLID